MKRLLAAFFILSAALLHSAGLACAANSPVIVTQTLTSYSAGGNLAALNYSIHVINPGDTPLANLTLSYVPLPSSPKGRAVLNVGNLGPHQSADLSLQLQAPARLGKDASSLKPLYWNGKYQDTQGQTIEFPAASIPGGVK
jgi:hypothetical protein